MNKAGEKLPGTCSPSNTQDMHDNVQSVLHFMMTRRIRMHHITAKGNSFTITTNLFILNIPDEMIEYSYMYILNASVRKSQENWKCSRLHLVLEVIHNYQHFHNKEYSFLRPPSESVHQKF